MSAPFARDYPGPRRATLKGSPSDSRAMISVFLGEDRAPTARPSVAFVHSLSAGPRAARRVRLHREGMGEAEWRATVLAACAEVAAQHRVLVWDSGGQWGFCSEQDADDPDDQIPF